MQFHVDPCWCFETFFLPKEQSFAHFIYSFKRIWIKIFCSPDVWKSNMSKMFFIGILKPISGTRSSDSMPHSGTCRYR